MDRLDYLYERYANNTATPEEREELYQIMLRTDPDKASIFKPFGEPADENEPDTIRDQQVLNEFFPEVVSNLHVEQEQEEIIPIDRDVRARGWWLRAAAAIIVLTLAGIGWYYNSISNSSREEVAVTQEAEKHFTFTGPEFVKLPDNTSVTLKKGSELSYTASFGKTSREVSLTGEAYFDVTHNPASPFKVHTGKIVTTVLGTAFNINASSTEQVAVTVTRGKVKVGTETRTYATLTPNEQIAVNTVTDEAVKTSVDAEAVVEWKEDYFILDKVTIAEAADLIGQRFNVKVIVNPALNPCIVNAWFVQHETLEQIVEAISAIEQAEFTITDGEVRIEGGRGCTP